MNDQTNSPPAPAEKVVFLEGSEVGDLDTIYQRLIEEAAIEETGLTLPRGYLSVSQINTYRTCPLRFFHRYIGEIISPPSAALAEGKAVHQGVAVGHIEAAKSNQVPPMSVLLDAHNDAWKTEKAAIDWKAEENDEDEATILSRDRVFLKNYHTSYLPNINPLRNKRDGTPQVEQRFWIMVGKENIPVLGYIDLVGENRCPDASGDPEVIDHKVVGRAKSQDDILSDLQLTVYSHATRIPRVRFTSFIKNKVPIIKSLGAIRTSADWTWAQFVITEVAKAISAGNFPPGADGWHCSKKFCGYWGLCHGK